MFSRNRDFVHFKLQAGNEIGKNLFHGQCNVYPNLQQKNKRTCQKSKTLYKHVEKRMRSYLSGLRISSTLIFMSSCDIVWKNIAKISLFVMFIIFFLVLVSTFCVFFKLFFLNFFIFDSLTIFHPLPVTRGKVLPGKIGRKQSVLKKNCQKK